MVQWLWNCIVSIKDHICDGLCDMSRCHTAAPLPGIVLHHFNGIGIRVGRERSR